MLRDGQWVQFKEASQKENYADLAQLFHELKDDEPLKAYRLLPKSIAAEVFAYLESDDQAAIIEAATSKEVTTLMQELFLDDVVDLLDELPASIVKKVLAHTDRETRIQINQLLRYEEGSAGSLMTIEFVDLKANFNVIQALERIKEVGVDSETIYTCYVIDNHRSLLGTVALRKLIICDPNTLISDIMHANPVYANTHDKQEDVAMAFKKYDLMAMPVVDSEKRLVGIITIDDIVDVIEEENTEDFEIMAAMRPSEKPYLKTSAFSLAKNRIVWLLILMISATISGSIIENFNSMLSSYVILVSFIPMLMNTGGNSGSQSSTLIIRGMALDEIKMHDFFKIIFKEFQVGIIAGIVLGVVNFARLTLISKTGLDIALVVSLALVATVIIAKLLGGALPMLASACKIDPAIMASPLITTIVDALALLIYFSLAVNILNIT